MDDNLGPALSRRAALTLIAGGAATVAGAGPAGASPGPLGAGDGGERPESAATAWRRLLDGNERFVAGRATHPRQTVERRLEVAAGQRPFACVLGCADSRVPPELVFDQGLGDLFVVRSAGEALDGAVVGSVEYAVALPVPLLVVLGHSGCGAVKAAVELVGHHPAQGRRGRGGRAAAGSAPTGDVSTIVRGIEAAVRATPLDPDEDAFLAACVAEQARRAAAGLVERSSLIRSALASGTTRVVVATYDLREGCVRAVG